MYIPYIKVSQLAAKMYFLVEYYVIILYFDHSHTNSFTVTDYLIYFKINKFVNYFS